jgi:hypothetical protein
MELIKVMSSHFHGRSAVECVRCIRSGYRWRRRVSGRKVGALGRNTGLRRAVGRSRRAVTHGCMLGQTGRLSWCRLSLGGGHRLSLRRRGRAVTHRRMLGRTSGLTRCSLRSSRGRAGRRCLYRRWSCGCAMPHRRMFWRAAHLRGRRSSRRSARSLLLRRLCRLTCRSRRTMAHGCMLGRTGSLRGRRRYWPCLYLRCRLRPWRRLNRRWGTMTHRRMFRKAGRLRWCCCRRWRGVPSVLCRRWNGRHDGSRGSKQCQLKRRGHFACLPAGGAR